MPCQVPCFFMRLGMGLFTHFTVTQAFSKITGCQLVQKKTGVAKGPGLAKGLDLAKGADADPRHSETSSRTQPTSAAGGRSGSRRRRGGRGGWRGATGRRGGGRGGGLRRRDGGGA